MDEMGVWEELRMNRGRTASGPRPCIPSLPRPVGLGHEPAVDGRLGVARKAIFSPSLASECGGGGAKVRPSARLLRLSPSPSHPRRDRHSPRSLAQFGAAAAAVDRFAAGVPTCYIASPTHRATQQPTKFQGVSSDAVVIISFCRVLEQPRRRYEPGHSVMM